jgi:MoxR-like ATPase
MLLREQVRSIEDVQRILKAQRYIADNSLATVIYLAFKLEKPLLLEGETGVGKTELAKVLAAGLGRRLIRLQCYEGLDANSALYEWNYPKQLLKIKMDEVCARSGEELTNIFSEEFLIRRPLLEAIHSESLGSPVVLLIDELDRSDEEFEAFLLEILSDFQVTVPEIGTLKARETPLVILTSNRTRDVHDALKRRCLYHWIDYPAVEKELEIVATMLPEINRELALQICEFMQKVRNLEFLKRPGIAETLDWAKALTVLHKDYLDPETVDKTLGCLFKYKQDLNLYKEHELELFTIKRPPTCGSLY